VRVHVYLTTTDSRQCPAGGGECSAETDLGLWEAEEHSRIVAAPHLVCERCGQPFGSGEGAVLMVSD
jgi:hypothetical protein